MSENLDLVRSIYVDWERGDFSSAEWADREIEYVMLDQLDEGSSTGLTGMAESIRSFLGAWEDFRVEAEEFRELDGRRVLVLDQQSGRGKTSGLEVGQMRPKAAVLFHLRDGKVTRLVVHFQNRDRALADLGLTPDVGTTDA